MRKCRTCGLKKSLKDFCKDAGDPSGLNSECRGCTSVRRRRHREARPAHYRDLQKNWRASSPEYKAKANDTRLKRDYGISLEQFNKMRVLQNDKCLICEEPMKMPHVDHCHETGCVRGLLCFRCNMGIGYLQDSPSLCLTSAAYLQKNISIKVPSTDAAGYASPC